MIANAQRSTMAIMVALATLLCCLCVILGVESYLRVEQKNLVLHNAEKTARFIKQQLTQDLSGTSSVAVLHQLKLDALEQSGYSFELWRTTPDNSGRETVARSATALIADPIIVPVDISGEAWSLGMAPSGGWGSVWREVMEAAISLLVALLAGRIASVQRTARNTLRESEQHQKRLFIEIPAIMHLIDREGVITNVSNLWLRTFGYERSEVIGRNANDFLNRRSFAADISILVPDMFQSGSPVEFECQYRSKDGRVLDMLVAGTGLKDDSGTTGVSMVVLTDVTQQKNAEARLKESLNFNETVLLKSPLPKGVYRASGPCVMANQAYAELVSGTREQLLSQNFKQILAFRESGLYEDCMDALADGQLRQREIRIRSSFGKEVWADCMILPTLLNNEPHLVLQFVDLTELHRQRSELQTTLDRLHTLLDLSSDGIHVLDENGYVVEFSQSFARMLGYSPAEASQLNVVNWDVTATPDQLRAGIRRRLGSPAATFETRHKKKDGTVIDVEVSCKGITLAGRELVYASSRDITERKRGETALRVSEDRFRRLIDHMPESILEVNEEGIIVLANARSTPLFGYDSAELIGKSIDLLVPDQFRSGHGAMREQYDKQPGTQAMGKSRYLNGLRKDGMEFPVEVALVPFFDAESRHVIVTATDISERRQSEEQLALFRNMIETAGDPFYMADLDDQGRMVFVNEAAARHFGQQRSEIYQWRLPEWDAQISFADLPSYIDRVQKEDAVVLQTWHRVSDGREVPVEISVNRYVDGSGRNFAFGWFKDVSRRLEVERLQREATEKAEAASRSKSDFLANMSHEIRTPMSAVLGLSQLLLDMNLQPQEKDYMVKLHNAARSLLGILNDILDYSKIEAGKLDLEHARFDLTELLDASAELFSTAAEEKNIELIFDVDPNLSTALQGDALRLKQIINNLLGNAIKFTHKGQVRLALRELHNDGKRSTLALSVSDSGIGMTAEQLAKLFNAFQQADTSTTRKFGGTGLGLAIVKRLSALMGGTISAVSEPDRGSTFTLTVAFDLAATNQLKNSANSPPVQWNDLHLNRERLASLRGAQILLVEDNLTNQLVARSILNRLGLLVSVANNGLEAIEMTSLNRYAAILMDLQMPEMGGVEATKRIRQLPGGRDVPIIAMTAAVMQVDRQACHEAGMNDFVSKPIDVTELSSALKRWTGLAPASVKLSDGAHGEAGGAFSIPGLELEASARRLGHNWAVLRRILESFLRDFSSAPAELDAQLVQNNLKDLARMVHTVKGLALTIGAQPLHDIAQQFDLELDSGHTGSASPFRRELINTLEAIAAGVAGRTSLTRPQTIGDDRLEPVLREILTIIDGSGYVWPELLEELTLLAEQRSEPLFLKIKNQINAFDYPAARATIIELAAKVAIMLEEGSV